MGKIFIRGGISGADPDEISARANDVVEGKTTIDDEGEVVQGSIRKMPAIYRANGERVASGGDGDNYIYTTIPNGAYLENSWTGKPELGVPIDSVRNAIGFRQDKILSDTTIAKVRGSVPISRTNNNHVKTANDGFAYFNEGNRTWQYVTRIDRGHFIDDYDWVGFPEPNLRPENIKQGVSIGKVVGTMSDYSRGRVVFNGATFDGELVSGVADREKVLSVKQINAFVIYDGNEWHYMVTSGHGANNYFGHMYDRDYQLLGIRDGGLRFHVKSTSADRDSWNNRILASYLLKNSVDLTPFRLIRIGYKVINRESGYGEHVEDAMVTVGIGVASTDITSGNSYWHATHLNSNYNYRSKAFVGRGLFYNIYADYDTGYRHELKLNVQEFLDLDISALTGQHFVLVGAGMERVRYLWADLIINHIEFIN